MFKLSKVMLKKVMLIAILIVSGALSAQKVNGINVYSVENDNNAVIEFSIVGGGMFDDMEVRFLVNQDELQKNILKAYDSNDYVEIIGESYEVEQAGIKVPNAKIKIAITTYGKPGKKFRQIAFLPLKDKYMPIEGQSVWLTKKKFYRAFSK